jgi:hypothetical protein
MHWNIRKGTKMAPRRPVAVRGRKGIQSARPAMAKLNKAIGVLSRLSSWRERESVFEVGDSLSSCCRQVSDV